MSYYWGRSQCNSRVNIAHDTDALSPRIATLRRRRTYRIRPDWMPYVGMSRGFSCKSSDEPVQTGRAFFANCCICYVWCCRLSVRSITLRRRSEITPIGRNTQRFRVSIRPFVAVAMVVTALIAMPAGALASTAPGLGTATSYAILAGTTVTNTGNSVITGDIGVSPGSACTGFPAPCTGGGPGTVSGTIHAADAQALQAKNDLTSAYGIAASSPCNFNKTGQNLGGQTLTPGTYCQTTAPTLTGTLTLSGNGVFIFQIGSTLVTAPGATVSFINGAQPCNVFWQVSSSATLDTTTTFVGTIMASTSISLNNGASIDGRALAQSAQVSLIDNRITVPTTCNAVTVAGPAVPGPSVPGTGGAPMGGSVLPWSLALIAAGVTSVLAALRSARNPRKGRARFQ
jgi:hypothetical protein